MRRAYVFLGLGILATGASLRPAEAQAGPPEPTDLAVSNLTLKGDFNPGGRIQLEATVTSKGKLPAGERRIDFAFQICTEKSSAKCTGVAHGSVTYTANSVTTIRSDWKLITPWLPKDGPSPTFVMVFVKDKAVQEDFANNEQWIPVSLGTLPKAPHGYAKFAKREIDKRNHAKLKKVSRDACLLACSADPHCKSVDYAPSTDTCYLQHVHREEVGSAYKKSTKYDHYARPCRLDDSAQHCNT